MSRRLLVAPCACCALCLLEACRTKSMNERTCRMEAAKPREYARELVRIEGEAGPRFRQISSVKLGIVALIDSTTSAGCYDHR